MHVYKAHAFEHIRRLHIIPHLSQLYDLAILTSLRSYFLSVISLLSNLAAAQIEYGSPARNDPGSDQHVRTILRVMFVEYELVLPATSPRLGG